MLALAQRTSLNGLPVQTDLAVKRRKGEQAVRFELRRTVSLVMPVGRLVALAMMVVGMGFCDVRRQYRRAPQQEKRGDHEDRSHDDVSR